MLSVNEQLERIVEVAVVLLVGAMIFHGLFVASTDWFWRRCCSLVIRPVSVWLGVWGDVRGRAPRRLLAWFGIRGIGSVYYAVYVAAHDLRYGDAVELLSCVFTVIGASIVVHGVSASPLMDLYQRRRMRGRAAPASVSDKR